MSRRALLCGDLRVRRLRRAGVASRIPGRQPPDLGSFRLGELGKVCPVQVLLGGRHREDGLAFGAGAGAVVVAARRHSRVPPAGGAAGLGQAAAVRGGPGVRSLGGRWGRRGGYGCAGAAVQRCGGIEDAPEDGVEHGVERRHLLEAGDQDHPQGPVEPFQGRRGDQPERLRQPGRPVRGAREAGAAQRRDEGGGQGGSLHERRRGDRSRRRRFSHWCRPPARPRRGSPPVPGRRGF